MIASIDITGIKYNVSASLEVKNVPFFSFTDAWPGRDRLFRRVSAELHISHHTAKKPRVRGRYTVMVVNGDLRQCGKVDMHALVAGDKIGEARIQCVKPFHKDRLPLPERHGRRIPLLFPSDEIKSRKPHRLSFQKCGDIS